jgi:hypothetical protein
MKGHIDCLTAKASARRIPEMRYFLRDNRIIDRKKNANIKTSLLPSKV